MEPVRRSSMQDRIGSGRVSQSVCRCG
jgi:hypothetical protein